MTRASANVKRRRPPHRFGPALLRAWVRAHAQALAGVLRQLLRAPAGSLLTVSVIGVALALPLGLYVALENVRGVGEGWNSTAARISLYLKTSVDDARAVKFASDLNGRPGIAAVELISRQEALNEYRELSGFREALAALNDNPLPAVVVVDPAVGADPGETLLEDLKKLPEVDIARRDAEWVRRLNAITALARQAVTVLAAILAAAVLLVVGNTIRLAVHQRRAEIEIAKLFGATDAFIRRPFLYTGLLYGGLGGAIACVLVGIGLLAVAAPVRELANLYQSDFRPRGLDPLGVMIAVFGSGLLGLLGAWVAATRHIRRLDVR